jgi:hypothetical protein
VLSQLERFGLPFMFLDFQVTSRALQPNLRPSTAGELSQASLLTASQRDHRRAGVPALKITSAVCAHQVWCFTSFVRSLPPRTPAFMTSAQRPTRYWAPHVGHE